MKTWPEYIDSVRPTITLQQVVDALLLASPICLFSRFEEVSHCIEVSTAAAEALHVFGIDARVVPCGVVAYSAARRVYGVLGVSPRFIHARTPGAPPFEAWLKRHNISGPSVRAAPLHVAVEVRHVEARVLIDLALGQLLCLPSEDLILQPVMPFPEGEWPCFEVGDWEVRYQANEQAPQVEELVRQYQEARGWKVNLETGDREHTAGGYAQDLTDLMALAHRVGCSRLDFLGYLRHVDPDRLDLTLRRWAAYDKQRKEAQEIPPRSSGRSGSIVSLA